MPPCLRTSALPFLSALLVCGRLFADDTEAERKTLRGIKAVRVVIEDLSADEVKDGLAAGQIRTDVELRLRKAGVVVQTSSPFILYIYPHLMVRETGLYIFHLEVAIMQDAVITANGEDSLLTTWSASVLGTVGRVNMSRRVREDIGDLVDQFLNAYLSVNPRQ